MGSKVLRISMGAVAAAVLCAVVLRTLAGAPDPKVTALAAPEPAPRPATLPPSATKEVVAGVQRYRVESHGIVQPVRSVSLAAEVSGPVRAVSSDLVNGGFVRQGDVLVELDDTEFRTRLAEAEAEYARAKLDVEIEMARAKIAESDWDKYFDGMAEVALGTRRPHVAYRLAAYQAARQRTANAKRQLEATRIRAPFDGLVQNKRTEVGAILGAGSVVADLLGTDAAEIRFPVKTADVRHLLRNDLPGLAVTVLSAEAGARSGRLVRSENVVDPDNRAMYFVARVEDPYDRNGAGLGVLPFGAYVTAGIDNVSVASALRIPAGLMRDGRIAIVGADASVQLHAVEIVHRTATEVIVDAGLRPGEKLVLGPVPAFSAASGATKATGSGAVKSP